MADHLEERAGRVHLLALDVDGVLTDGGVYVMEDGRQFRRFDIKDGLGLKLVMAAGVQVALISASEVACVRSRADGLGIVEVHLACEDKLTCLKEIVERLGISLEQVAYMGDDLTDLTVLEKVGVPCAPADAVSEVLEVAKIVTARSGGRGAVREVCEWIMSQNETHYRVKSMPTTGAEKSAT